MAQGQVRESVRMALETLRANKLRSGLTILASSSGYIGHCHFFGHQWRE